MRQLSCRAALPSGLAGSIDIGNQPGLLAPILDPTGVSERSAGEQILLEQGTQAFHARLIECEMRYRESAEREGKRERPNRAMNPSAKGSKRS